MVTTDTSTRVFYSFPLEQHPAVCLAPTAIIRKHLKTHLFDLGLSSFNTSMPSRQMVLWNCFTNFAVEHWFGCHATEPGDTGDIGAIEIWLIDWLISSAANNSEHHSLARTGDPVAGATKLLRRGEFSIFKSTDTGMLPLYSAAVVKWKKTCCLHFLCVLPQITCRNHLEFFCAEVKAYN